MCIAGNTRRDSSLPQNDSSERFSAACKTPPFRSATKTAERGEKSGLASPSCFFAASLRRLMSQGGSHTTWTFVGLHTRNLCNLLPHLLADEAVSGQPLAVKVITTFTWSSSTWTL